MGQRQIWHVEKKKKKKSFVALGLGTVFELHKNRRRLAFHNPYGSKLKFGYYLTKWQVNQWSLEGILGINLINKVVDLALSLPSNGALKWLNLCVAFQDSYMLKALVHGFMDQPRNTWAGSNYKQLNIK